MISQALPDPNSFAAVGWLLLTLASLAVAVVQVLKLVDRARGKAPNPPNEQLESGRRELERRVTNVEVEVCKLRTDLGHEREFQEASARSRSDKIYAKIDELRVEMTNQFKDTERALGRIEGKLSKGDEIS
jgi:hypothetical protein